MSQKGRIKNIDEFYVFERGGVVVDRHSWVKTDIQTTTRGGHGHISVPTTTTSVSSTENIRLFIRQEHGEEWDIRLVDLNVGIREGHRVSIIFAGKQDSCVPVEIFNHTTGTSQTLTKNVNGLAFGPLSPVGLVLATVISLMGGAPVFLLTLPLSCYFLFYKNKKMKNLKQAIAARLDQEIPRLIAASR